MSSRGRKGKAFLSLFRLVPRILLLLILCSCARFPLVQVPENRLPEFTDDMQLASLETAVAANLKYLRTREPLETALFGGQEYSVADLIRTQVFFLKLLAERPAPDTLNQRIRENFDVFQAAGTGGINLRRNMLVTGYYQPVFEGSLHKEEPFLHPIYSVPPDLVRQKTPAGKYTVGRLEDGRLVPYWSRAEIELDGRAAGSEIAWLKDPFDAFVLHVQGSGLIRLRDGSLRSIHFAAKNGHPYRSIGRYMVRTGRMSLADAGMQTIRKYLADNPGERREILHHNPSFIFFDWSSTRGAVGNLGRELTGGRSIAVDQQCFPSGALAFLFTRKPTAEGEEFGSRQPLHRFVVVQDTGSAIRGPGRVDLYWGTGKEAGERAGRMKEPGRLYFFILKDEEPVSEPADRG